jgi:hypothetical protein
MMAAGSIVIDLLLKSGSFETDTKRAQKELEKLKREAADIGKVVGLAFAGAIAATAAFVKQSIDAADEMSKAAQSAGVTVEALSGLKYAADLAGVSFEGLQTGLKKLNTNIFEANQGSKSQAEAFKMLGISVKDAEGNLKSADGVLVELAERFSKMPDGVEKSALAVQIFGKAGTDLIPLLNSGANGIKELTDEADRLGIVLDTNTAKAAEEFNDQMSRVGYAFDGLKLQLASALLPLLNEFADAMVETSKASKGVTDTNVTTWAQDTAYAIAFTADAANAAVATFVQFGKSIAVVFNDIKTFSQVGALVANPISAFVNRDKVSKLIKENKAFTQAANEDLQAYLNGNYTRFRDSLSKTYESAAKSQKDFQKLVDIPVKGKGGKSGKTDRDFDLENFAKLQQDIADLINKSQEASGPELSRARQLQNELDAYERIDPAVKEYIQGLINIAKAQEQIDDLAKFDADQMEDEVKAEEERQRDIEKAMQDYEKLYTQLSEQNENLNIDLIADDKKRIAAQIDLENDRRIAVINSMKIEADERARLLELNDEVYEKLKKKSLETTDAITEFWKEAAHNMQDAMSDFFFDAMQGDLDDLAGNFKRTIDRMVANLLASKLLDSIGGEGFAKSGSPSSDSFLGGIGSFLGSLLPSFDVGTPYVQQDMVAKIHKGERILTASENRAFSSGAMGGGAVYMTINTPNADSFRKSQPQIMAEMQRGLNRGRRVT